MFIFMIIKKLFFKTSRIFLKGLELSFTASSEILGKILKFHLKIVLYQGIRTNHFDNFFIGNSIIAKLKQKNKIFLSKDFI